ncbi:MAG: hypothetical protein AAFZ15_32655 [Bacteroidota bacterium]
MGQRTSNILVVILAFIWVQSFAFGSKNFEGLWENPVTKSDIFESESLNTIFEFLLRVLGYIARFFLNVGDVLYNFFLPENWDEISVATYIFGFVVLILGISHLVREIKSSIFYENDYSRERGQSVFFGWLVGKSFLGNSSLVFSNTMVWMVVEPLFVASLGFLFINVPGGDVGLGLCFITSASALFLEEFTVYKKMRGNILDYLDSEFEAELFETAVSKYKRRELGAHGKVSEQGVLLAGKGSIEKMKVYLKDSKKVDKRNNKQNYKPLDIGVKIPKNRI